MAFGKLVEISCSNCQRRFAVADHKVAGRRRQSQCRCGNLLVFDGRHLSPQEQSSSDVDSQALFPHSSLDEATAPLSDASLGHQHSQPVGRIALERASLDRVTPEAVTRSTHDPQRRRVEELPASKRTPPPKPLRRPTPSSVQPELARADIAANHSAANHPAPDAHATSAPPRVHHTAQPPNVHSRFEPSTSNHQRAAGATAPPPATTPGPARDTVSSTTPEPAREPQGAAPVSRRPEAPHATRVSESTSGDTKTPGDLHAAFGSLAESLDSIADRIRPQWDAAWDSKRISVEGEEPEVTVHFPPEWQPPPSVRRGMLVNWESPPAPPASEPPDAAQTSLDEGWTDGDYPSEPVVPAAQQAVIPVVSAEAQVPAVTRHPTLPVEGNPVEGDDAARVASDAEVRARLADDGIRPSLSSADSIDPEVRTSGGPSQETVVPTAAAPDPRQRDDTPPPSHTRVGNGRGARSTATRGARSVSSKPDGPGKASALDSTAPAAVSQPPVTEQAPSSKRGLAAALALAALALLVVGLRVAGSEPESKAARPLEAIPVGPPVSTPAQSDATEQPAAQNHSAPTKPSASELSALDERSAAAQADPPAPTASDQVPRVQPQPAREHESAEPGSDSHTRATVAADRAPRAPATNPPPATAPRLEKELETSDTTHARSTGSNAAASRALPLDAKQVQLALASAAGQATRCASPRGPAGRGSVRIVLDPAGGVLNATVTSAPFAGTEIGRCVERAFEGARTSAFAGRSLTTLHPFHIPSH